MSRRVADECPGDATALAKEPLSVGICRSVSGLPDSQPVFFPANLWAGSFTPRVPTNWKNVGKAGR